MKNKKIYSILIAAAFICISFTAVASAKILPKEIAIGIVKEFEDTGTVIKDGSNIKNPFLIKGDDGVKIGSRYYDTYYPINLPQEYKQEGLKVGFTAKASLFMSLRYMMICINYRVLPITITKIWRIDEPVYGGIAGYAWERDDSGGYIVIENVKVTATLILPQTANEQEETTYEDYTNQWGIYRIGLMKPGEYKLVATHEEYNTETVITQVRPNKENCINFTLYKAGETAQLILDTNPNSLPLDVFSYSPEPDDMLATTDGKLHLIYQKGTEVTITVEEWGEYIFEKWMEDASGNDNPLIVLMDTDKSINALYSIVSELPPVACFTYNPSIPLVGKEVTFDASCSSDENGKIVEYKWVITMDNSLKQITHNGKIVKVILSLPGIYKVTLTVTDDDGLTDSISKNIVVKELVKPIRDIEPIRVE